MSNIAQMLQDPRMREILAQQMAAKGVAPPGPQTLPQTAGGAAPPLQRGVPGGAPLSMGALMQPRTRPVLPQSAQPMPGRSTGIGALMQPRRF